MHPQSLQVKVQEGQAARDREGRLEAHCHLLEKRCSYLVSSNYLCLFLSEMLLWCIAIAGRGEGGGWYNTAKVTVLFVDEWCQWWY